MNRTGPMPYRTKGGREDTIQYMNMHTYIDIVYLYMYRNSRYAYLCDEVGDALRDECHRD